MDKPKDPVPAGPRFPIRAYRTSTAVLQSRFLAPEERAELLPTLQKVMSIQEDDYGGACHFPIHGLRIHSGTELVLETSLCYHCGNMTVEYSDGAGFLGLGEHGKALEAVMTKLMPIPDSEKKRFYRKSPIRHD